MSVPTRAALSQAYALDTHANLRWAYCLILDEFGDEGCTIQALIQSAFALHSIPPDEAQEVAYDLASRGLAEIRQNPSMMVVRTAQTRALLAYEIPCPDGVARPAAVEGRPYWEVG